jgi:hypothetical protein
MTGAVCMAARAGGARDRSANLRDGLVAPEDCGHLLGDRRLSKLLIGRGARAGE